MKKTAMTVKSALSAALMVILMLKNRLGKSLEGDFTWRHWKEEYEIEYNYNTNPLQNRINRGYEMSH